MHECKVTNFSFASLFSTLYHYIIGQLQACMCRPTYTNYMASVFADESYTVCHDSYVASQFVITFQFVINYYKLERICTAAASQFVINYYKLARICNVFAFQFVIKYYILDDTQSTLENKGERSLPLSSRYRVNVGFDILIIHIIKLT